MLLKKLKTTALERAGAAFVTDVRIGLGYTAVQLDTGSVGLAYTFRDKAEHGCSVFHGKRPLAGSPVGEILHFMTSNGTLERTIGVAAANAVFNTAETVTALAGCRSYEGDLLDVLSLTKEDTVGRYGGVFRATGARYQRAYCRAAHFRRGYGARRRPLSRKQRG